MSPEQGLFFFYFAYITISIMRKIYSTKKEVTIMETWDEKRSKMINEITEIMRKINEDQEILNKNHEEIIKSLNDINSRLDALLG